MRRFILGLLLALALAAPAAAQTVTKISGGGIATGTANFNITTTADCNPGSVIAVTYASPAGALTSVTDAASNTYVVAFSGPASGGSAFAPVTTKLSSGSTISLNSGSTTGPKSGLAACITLASSATSGLSNNNGASATTGTVTSGTFTIAQTVAIATLQTTGSATSAFTPGGSWTGIVGNCQTTSCANMAYQLLNATTAVTFTPTWTTSAAWGVTVQGLRETLGGASGAIMGVGQ